MNHRILIVEDEFIVQLHLRKTVEEIGYDVCGVAASCDEALSVAAENQPDLVLMDIRIQGERDGIDTARELRERYNAGVVFVTAFADEETLERTEPVGALGYIVKPFTQPQVRAVLKTALAGHERLRRVESRERSLETALANMGEAVIMADTSGHVTFMNAPASALTGWSDKDAEAQPLDMVLGGNSDGSPQLKAAVERLMAGGSADHLDDVIVVRRDGSHAHVTGEIEPLDDVGGERRGVIVFLRDRAREREREDRLTEARLTSFGAGTRMLIYSHDTYGLGHLQRCLNLSRSLLEQHPGLSILLVTGSAAAHRFKLPPGLDYVKLPAVRKVAPEQYEARTLHMSDEGVQTLRKNLLLRTVRDY
jgi:PAS domain S-box-containing protein